MQKITTQIITILHRKNIVIHIHRIETIYYFCSTYIFKLIFYEFELMRAMLMLYIEMINVEQVVKKE